MKFSGVCTRVVAMLLMVAVQGCATRAPDVVKDTGGMEAGAQAWVRTELYFSIGDWTETALSTEAELKWAKFLDAEVTPRFPDGLKVIDVYGQRRSAKPGAVVERERSRLLVIVHADSAEADVKVEAVRAAWKLQDGEESVLRVSVPAKVGF